jgi:hypothetical protein
MENHSEILVPQPSLKSQTRHEKGRLEESLPRKADKELIAILKTLKRMKRGAGGRPPAPLFTAQSLMV